MPVEESGDRRAMDPEAVGQSQGGGTASVRSHKLGYVCLTQPPLDLPR
jgi:hypothetical protein